jgi:hypothetical protein
MLHIHPKYIKPNDHVDVWDLGPKRVDAPAPPVEPVESKELKGADFALAKIHYEDALETYRADLRGYGAAKVEFKKWHDVNGGPIKTSMWSTDAKQAINTEPERWVLDLPRGMKPGKSQIEADALAEMSEQELQEARDKDPQFGKGTSR